MGRWLLLAVALAAAGCKARTPEQVSPTPKTAGLDPASLERYVAYEKGLVAALGPLTAQPDAGNLADAIDQATARVQRDAGLSNEALHAWEALTVELFRAEPPGAASAPPPSKVSPTPQADPLADARRNFGDAAVDAAVAREPELYRLHMERAQLLKRLTAAAGG